jgi:1-acyl-sn-glycerol-3-phosphate acyltransferase
MWLIPVAGLLALVLIVRRRVSGLGWTDYLLLTVVKAYASFWHRVAPCVSPFPRHGPALVVANHTCSADPIFLGRDSPRPLSFITTREHFNLSRPSRWLLEHLGCVPVQRGGHDPVGVRQALRRLREGHVLCLFPEGGLSGVALGRMRRWKYGAAYLALKSGVPVYPVWIEGGPRTDRLLPAWLGRSGKQVRVHYGPAVDLSAYTRQRITRALLEQVTELLMRCVQALQPLSACHR